jgi:hypothetical protein
MPGRVSSQEGLDMMKIKVLLASSVAVALALTLSASVRAVGLASRTTYLTFSGAVALPGVELKAGTYVFELPEPNEPTIVRVMSRDRHQVYLTAFTRLVDRPSNMRRDQLITLGEARRGVAPPITAWFPVDDSLGREFIYSR